MSLAEGSRITGAQDTHQKLCRVVVPSRALGEESVVQGKGKYSYTLSVGPGWQTAATSAGSHITLSERESRRTRERANKGR